MSSDSVLLPGERLDDLERNGLKLLQHPDVFCFGTDSVLLASFAKIKKNERVADLGTGSGIILILMSARCQAKEMVGLELQPRIADMAQRSVNLNGLSDLIKIYPMDLRDAAGSLGYGTFDCVVCNPPYTKAGCGHSSASLEQRIAREEICVTLAECVQSASKLLRNGGRAYFVHQSDRLLELWQEMRSCRIEPKRTRLVSPNKNKAPNLVLCEGVLNGNPGIIWLPGLFVFEDGKYSDEINAIYHRGGKHG